jgi:AcrR family transcriptional regulator
MATRLRVLGAATRLFAEHGFRRVTVRQICEAAHANVASVNYHFGDKQRLYREVVEQALDMVRGFSDQAMAAPPGASAEEKLAHYIFAHLARAQSSGAARRASLLRAIFRHEFSEPTELAEYIVEQAIKPRLRYLGSIVGELLGAHAEPEAVNHCVMSIQAQCLFPAAAPLALALGSRTTPAEPERLARHVFEFSLAGIRARAASPPRSERARAAALRSADRTNPRVARGAGRR